MDRFGILKVKSPELKFLKVKSPELKFLVSSYPADESDEVKLFMAKMRIFSGGQTGIDQIALEEAHKYSGKGIETGGWAPNNYMTSKGVNPDLGTIYGLETLHTTAPLSGQYVIRSRMNVDESDATLAFSLYTSVGTTKTIHYSAKKRWGPLLVTPYTENGLWILSDEPQAPGEDGVVEKLHRPCFVITSVDSKLRDHQVSELLRFIKVKKIKTLNICGHRAGVALLPYETGARDLIRCLMEGISRET